MDASKYLNSYKSWQRYQYNKRLLLGYLITLLIIWVLSFSIVIIEGYLITLFNTSLLILIFTWTFFFIWATLIVPKDMNLREVIIFSALKANDELSRGDAITASVAVDKLIYALSQLLSRGKISFVNEKFPIKKLLSVNPDKISKKSIRKYLQLRENSNEINAELNRLAKNLIETKEADYLAAQRFLVFLKNNVDDLVLPSKIDYLVKISPIFSLLSPLPLIK